MLAFSIFISKPVCPWPGDQAGVIFVTLVKEEKSKQEGGCLRGGGGVQDQRKLAEEMKLGLEIGGIDQGPKDPKDLLEG